MARKTKESSEKDESSSEDTFAARYSHIADWVMDGWIEIGSDEFSTSLVRALDTGGLVWEGENEYATMDDALQALDAGIAAWVEENR